MSAMNVTYIKKAKIEWPALWTELGMKKDSGGHTKTDCIYCGKRMELNWNYR